MFERFLDFIKKLFGREPVRQREAADAQAGEKKWRRLDEVNFTAIFAQKLSSLALSDASMKVEGPEGARGDLVRDALEDAFRRMRDVLPQALGSGGRVLIPYVSGGALRLDVVAQDRMYITGMDGERITSASFLSDVAEVNKRVYYRWTDYALAPGTGETIRTRITDEVGHAAAFDVVEAWADIPEEIVIPGAERLTFAFLRSPVTSRMEKRVYGVPITYGCDAILDEIREHLHIIRREYKLTRPMLGLSSDLWKRGFDGGAPAIENLRVTVQDGDDPFIPAPDSDTSNAPWMIYSPAIRDSALYARMDRLFEQLEKAVGVSRGILTARETVTATATEIRAANHDTFAMVSAIRDAVRRCMEELAYGFDLLAEAFDLSPSGARGEWDVSIDWDMSLFESAEETYAQLAELQSRGLMSGAELRSWVTGESEEAAQAAIDEIRASGEGESAIDRLLKQTGADGDE